MAVVKRCDPISRARRSSGVSRSLRLNSWSAIPAMMQLLKTISVAMALSPSQMVISRINKRISLAVTVTGTCTGVPFLLRCRCDDGPSISHQKNLSLRPFYRDRTKNLRLHLISSPSYPQEQSAIRSPILPNGVSGRATSPCAIEGQKRRRDRARPRRFLPSKPCQ